MDDKDPIDDDPSPLELAEAEALARALDRGTGSGELPGEALEAAALLRYSAGDDALAPGPMQSILDGVLDSAKAPPARAENATNPLVTLAKWLFPVAGLAAAAAVALLVVTSRDSAPAAGATATALPAPTAELLRAQAQAAGQSEEGRVALASAMGSYRGAVLGSLHERYGR